MLHTTRHPSLTNVSVKLSSDVRAHCRRACAPRSSPCSGGTRRSSTRTSRRFCRSRGSLATGSPCALPWHRRARRQGGDVATLAVLLLRCRMSHGACNADEQPSASPTVCPLQQRSLARTGGVGVLVARSLAFAARLDATCNMQHATCNRVHATSTWLM
jgi:hypothetical protein